MYPSAINIYDMHLCPIRRTQAAVKVLMTGGNYVMDRLCNLSFEEAKAYARALADLLAEVGLPVGRALNMLKTYGLDELAILVVGRDMRRVVQKTAVDVSTSLTPAVSASVLVEHSIVFPNAERERGPMRYKPSYEMAA